MATKHCYLLSLFRASVVLFLEIYITVQAFVLETVTSCATLVSRQSQSVSQQNWMILGDSRDDEKAQMIRMTFCALFKQLQSHVHIIGIFFRSWMF